MLLPQAGGASDSSTLTNHSSSPPAPQRPSPPRPHLRVYLSISTALISPGSSSSSFFY